MYLSGLKTQKYINQWMQIHEEIFLKTFKNITEHKNKEYTYKITWMERNKSMQRL